MLKNKREKVAPSFVGWLKSAGAVSVRDTVCFREI